MPSNADMEAPDPWESSQFQTSGSAYFAPAINDQRWGSADGLSRRLLPSRTPLPNPLAGQWAPARASPQGQVGGGPQMHYLPSAPPSGAHGAAKTLDQGAKVGLREAVGDSSGWDEGGRAGHCRSPRDMGLPSGEWTTCEGEVSSGRPTRAVGSEDWPREQGQAPGGAGGRKWAQFLPPNGNNSRRPPLGTPLEPSAAKAAGTGVAKKALFSTPASQNLSVRSSKAVESDGGAERFGQKGGCGGVGGNFGVGMVSGGEKNSSDAVELAQRDYGAESTGCMPGSEVVGRVEVETVAHVQPNDNFDVTGDYSSVFSFL